MMERATTEALGMEEILELARQAGAREAGRAEPLLRGYSADLKFVVYAGDVIRWLVRVSPADTLARRETEARLLEEFHSRGIPCPKPLAAGTARDGWAYLVTTFVAGVDAEQAMASLSPEAQHRIGRAAGQCLAALHERPGRESTEAWIERRIRKYRRRVAQVDAFGIPFPERTEVEAYIADKLTLLRDSPVRFQHDDFHPGNLVVRDSAFGGVIDFNRCDEGDPVEDFYKVPLFTAPQSPPFARGQVEGYLDAARPHRFWERYHLLLALNLHGMLAWIRETGSDSEIREWDRLVAEIVSRHDWRNPDRPAWFMRSGN